jgi:nucleoside-diphosphate-sugar epimerase
MTPRHALVVGGTGPTGPHIVAGLADRGFEVTVLHTGRHEIERDRATHHLHADPYDESSVREVLGRSEFDLALVSYGRLRGLSSILVGRTERFFSIGAFAVYNGAVAADPDAYPSGPRVPLVESSPVASATPGVGGSNAKLAHIVQSEAQVFEDHPGATHFRYSGVYGPRHPMPVEWLIVKRILDGRREIILPDGGLTLRSRVFAENAAAVVLAAVDEPEIVEGRVFNVSDSWSPTLAQQVEMVSTALGRRLDVVSMPYELATPSHPLVLMGDPGHRVTPGNLATELLGHVEPVAPETGWELTARWLASNAPGSQVEKWLGDAFDYSAEDALIETWKQCMPMLTAAASHASSGFVSRYHESTIASPPQKTPLNGGGSTQQSTHRRSTGAIT